MPEGPGSNPSAEAKSVFLIWRPRWDLCILLRVREIVSGTGTSPHWCWHSGRVKDASFLGGGQYGRVRYMAILLAVASGLTL